MKSRCVYQVVSRLQHPRSSHVHWEKCAVNIHLTRYATLCQIVLHFGMVCHVSITLQHVAFICRLGL